MMAGARTASDPVEVAVGLVTGALGPAYAYGVPAGGLSGRAGARLWRRAGGPGQ